MSISIPYRLKALINSLTPRVFFFFSFRRMSQRNHWAKQKFGDVHGCQNYMHHRPQIPYLIDEINSRVKHEHAVLDLGCNCGYYLFELKKAGYKNLTGVDISSHAIKFGKKYFDLQNTNMHIGAFENVLPELLEQGRKFDVIFSMGASIELVHPSFDIIKYLARLSDKYVILFIWEWGRPTARLYEYEFQKYGFLMVKCIRPFDGSEIDTLNLKKIQSLLVFKKVT